MECVLHAVCLTSVRVFWETNSFLYITPHTKTACTPPPTFGCRCPSTRHGPRPTYIITASGLPYTNVLIIMTYTLYRVVCGTHSGRSAKTTGNKTRVAAFASRI